MFTTIAPKIIRQIIVPRVGPNVSDMFLPISLPVSSATSRRENPSDMTRVIKKDMSHFVSTQLALQDKSYRDCAFVSLLIYQKTD